MHKKLRMALVAALVTTGGWSASAAATSDAGDCERNGHNASGCDFDGDGTNNQDDTDDDGDGTPDDEDTCRSIEEPCDEGEGGGETPALPDPADLVAQVEAAVAELVGQLPPAPGGEEPPAEEPPAEEPPAEEPPADPAAEIQAIVDEVTGQLPPPPAPPADPAAEAQAAVEALVAQLPAPPAP